MLGIAERAGANLISRDRMWHYVEGIPTGTRCGATTASGSCPRPSSLWLDATGQAPARAALPGLRHARHARAHRDDRPRLHLVRPHPQDHRASEFALSGSEQNPDITGKSIRELIRQRVLPGRARAGPGVHGPRAGLRRRATTSRALVRGMNALTDEPLLDFDARASARSWRATARSTNPYTQGRPGHGHPRRPRATSPTASSASPRRTASSTRRPAR